MVNLQSSLLEGRALAIFRIELARRERTFTSFVVLTAYAVAIARWCREHDLILTVQSNARTRPELESTIGYLSNMLFLRIRLSRQESFLGLLGKITDEYWSSHHHRDYDRVPDFVPECRSDLLSSDVYFNWLPEQTSSASSEPWRTGENLKIEPFHFELAAPARFLPLFRDVEDGIHLTVIFREDMLKRTTIQQFGRELIGVARKLTRDSLAMLALAL